MKPRADERHGGRAHGSHRRARRDAVAGDLRGLRLHGQYRQASHPRDAPGWCIRGPLYPNTWGFYRYFSSRILQTCNLVRAWGKVWKITWSRASRRAENPVAARLFSDHGPRAGGCGEIADNFQPCPGALGLLRAVSPGQGELLGGHRRLAAGLDDLGPQRAEVPRAARAGRDRPRSRCALSRANQS